MICLSFVTRFYNYSTVQLGCREEMMSRKALGYTSAIAATLMVSYWLLSRKRRYENELKDVLDPDEDDDFNSINNPNIVEDENQIEFILRQSFLSAAAAASSLVQSGVQDDVKLLLYGLYKQATVGDCNINAVSCSFDTSRSILPCLTLYP